VKAREGMARVVAAEQAQVMAVALQAAMVREAAEAMEMDAVTLVATLDDSPHTLARPAQKS
jgi:hypothetical protein